jgi:hypothetical protein
LTRSVVITNSGDVPLSSLVLQPSAGGAATTTVSCPGNTVAFGGSIICSITITPLQSSLDDGLVITVNAAATAQGDGNTVEASAAPVTIAAVQSPDFTYTLTAGAAPALPSAGDTVSLTLAVSNKGNVKFNTVTPAFTVNGNALALAGTACDISSSSFFGLSAKGTGATAAVGPCGVDYAITQAHIENGALVITGQVTATYT